MSFQSDYIFETGETLELTSHTEIFYNCTECSSSIEILSLDEKEGMIEFQCTNNNHKKKMSIKEYIIKMKNYTNNIINNDICSLHNLKYECYCIDCNVHLCKECLKLRKHLNHIKNNIIEVQPSKKELDIMKDIKKYYEEKMTRIEKEKIKRKKELDNKLNEFKNKLKENKDLKLKENTEKMESELNLNKDKYINDLKNFIIKIGTEMKSRKKDYKVKINEINNKYKLINEKDIITYNQKLEKLEKLDMKYIEKIQKFKYDINIENCNYIKRLVGIVYDTYKEYNNNYYNSMNINNILVNFHENEIYSNSDLDEDFENLIKQKTTNKNNKNNNCTTKPESKVIEIGKIKYIINDCEDKIKNLKLEYENKMQDMNLEYNKIINKLKIEYENEIKNRIITKRCKNGRYEGELKNGKRDGKGLFQWLDGDIYFGDWKDDKREGKGKYCYSDGDVYLGDWVNDKKEGKGVYSFNHGNKYDGDFQNDKREGKGIEYYKNGTRYEGDFKNNKREGKGIFFHSNGDREMGDYFNGKQIGKHVILTVNGDVKIHYYE